VSYGIWVWNQTPDCELEPADVVKLLSDATWPSRAAVSSPVQGLVRLDTRRRAAGTGDSAMPSPRRAARGRNRRPSGNGDCTEPGAGRRRPESAAARCRHRAGRRAAGVGTGTAAATGPARRAAGIGDGTAAVKAPGRCAAGIEIRRNYLSASAHTNAKDGMPSIYLDQSEFSRRFLLAVHEFREDRIQSAHQVWLQQKPSRPHF
jgi:hypothetical protein